MKRVPVSVLVLALMVAVPAPGKVANPLLDEAKFTADGLSEVQVTAPVAPTAVNVALGAPTL